MPTVMKIPVYAVIAMTITTHAARNVTVSFITMKLMSMMTVTEVKCFCDIDI